jgi:ABC-type lipoprotein release transport system permease subunit
MVMLTTRAFFGALQSAIAFVYIILALILSLNAFNVQSAFNITAEALNFDVAVLLAVGFVSLAGGLFLVYDWWESR